MIRVGITGQEGFIGNHLYNRLSLLKDEFEVIDFEKGFFQDDSSLVNWVNRCDVIVHLAAVNRHENSQTLLNINISLVEKLIHAMESINHKCHVIFSSSNQEEKVNSYGFSKRQGRLLLSEWAIRNSTSITGMVIPNVFGPFGKPFYNSVIATFCFQLCNDETPKIDIDANLKLIFVDELVNEIITHISKRTNDPELKIKPTSEHTVSAVLSTLIGFKNSYFDLGIIPAIEDSFSINLFNTFRSFINYEKYFPQKYNANIDDRGQFVELIKLQTGGQISFSTTVPGIIRGNHFHSRKIERFSVIKGKALVKLRRLNTKKVLHFELDGNEPSYIDMPVWYIHNIKNIGNEDLYTIFWINEFYDPSNSDTYFEVV